MGWMSLMMSLVVTSFVLSFPTGYLEWDHGIELCQFLKTFLLIFDYTVKTVRRDHSIKREDIFESQGFSTI